MISWDSIKRFFNRPHVRALLKAVIFGLLLLNVQRVEYSSFSVAIFVLWALYIYLTPVSRRLNGFVGWAVLVGLSLLMPSRFTLVAPQWAPHHVLPEHLFAIIFTLLCYIFICAVQRIVPLAQRWYQVLHAGLIWGTSLLFISGVSGAHPLRATILGAILIYALTVEYLHVHGQEHRRLVHVTSALTALQYSELAWVLRLLPFSIGYVAVILSLAAIIATSASEQYLRGTLRGPFLRYAGIIIALVAIVMATSTRWIL